MYVCMCVYVDSNESCQKNGQARSGYGEYINSKFVYKCDAKG